jgi:hypothetical protein
VLSWQESMEDGIENILKARGVRVNWELEHWKLVKIEACLEYVELLMKRKLLTSMNEMIVKNNQIGIYNGCENAIRIALERAEMNK